jgi:site-specific recombinase XerD
LAKFSTVLYFEDITPVFLNKYEQSMIKEGNSLTTIGIYLRSLRAIYNLAIEKGIVKSVFYPFGKRKYQIPKGANTKKAITHADVQKIANYTIQNPNNWEEQARDLWMLSYLCNGMNIKDIAMLRYENLQNESLYFYRAKTINTNKTDLKPTVVYLTEKSLETIRKYGNPNSNPKQLIFSIIDDTLTEEQNYFKIKNFTRFINQHIKHLAKDLGLSQDISTYWARHSFASKAIREGASIEFVGEAFNHSNPKTTMNYFAGFEDNTKKEFTKKLMDI